MDEEENEDIDNSFNLVLREKEYRKEIYQINEEVKHNKNINKLYGYNKERNLNVVITKIMNVSLEENPKFVKRLLITIKLIEENKILVENLWVEKEKENNYTLYLSELTNSIYRNNYNLITLNNYMNSIQNTYKENIELLISIVQKMLYFNSINFAHLNIHPNNIYINIKNKNSIYFGPPNLVKKFANDCTYLWYSSPEYNYSENEIWEDSNYGNSNDLWSLGCIICEMFFITFPIFQVYSPNEKIMKIFEILGFPEYEDVDYMNKYQYNSFVKKSTNCYKRKNNLVGFLLSSREEHSNLYNFKIELIDIINGCLNYNRTKRITLNYIIKRLNYLNCNISSEFQSKIMYTTIINSEESENNKYIIDTNYKYKINKNNNSIESEEENYIENDNNNNDSNEYNYSSSLNNNEINNVKKSKFIKNNIKNKKLSLDEEINNRAKKIIINCKDNKDYEKESKKDNKKNNDNNDKSKQILKNKEEVDEYQELQKSKLTLYNQKIIFLYYFRNRRSC